APSPPELEGGGSLASGQRCSRPPTQLWRELASGAESGWDFSTRWLRSGSRGGGGGSSGREEGSQGSKPLGPSQAPPFGFDLMATDTTQ
ncbi:alpha,alpha-trehalose glucohydrolase, partial [Haematococcus lacustris]